MTGVIYLDRWRRKREREAHERREEAARAERSARLARLLGDGDGPPPGGHAA